jgi:hypothetical protein
MRFAILVLLSMFIGNCGLVVVASAQGPQSDRERRRQAIEGILFNLVETHLLRDRDREPPRGPQPGQPIPPVHRHVDGAKYRDAQRAVQSFSEESGRLIGMLREEERLSPGIRPLLGDAISIKAKSDALLRRGYTHGYADAFARDFQEIDRQWRVLSHRLEQTEDLSGRCRDHVKKMCACNHQVCELFDIDPQVDRHELIRHSAALANELRSILEHLSRNARRGGAYSELLREGPKLHLQIRYWANAVANNAPYDSLVSQYKGLHTNWRAFAARLRSVDHRYYEQHIHHIDRANDAIHDLLWITPPLDQAAIAHGGNLLHQDMDELCGMITLQMLLSVQNAPELIGSVQEFHHLCEDFQSCAARKADIEDLRWDYRLLEVEWQQMAGHFEAIHQEAVSRRLADMEQTIQFLRDSLGIRPLFDRESALVLAAETDALADMLNRDLSRCLSKGQRYAPQFRRDAQQCAGRFRDAAHRFHERLVTRADDAAVKKDCEELSQSWRHFQEHVSELERQDQVLLSRHISRVAPAMAKLQVMLAY